MDVVYFDQRFGANLKNCFLLNFAPNLLLFLHFFSFLAQKMLKLTISTSVWGAKHPNTGQNIQHMELQILNSMYINC